MLSEVFSAMSVVLLSFRWRAAVSGTPPLRRNARTRNPGPLRCLRTREVSSERKLGRFAST